MPNPDTLEADAERTGEAPAQIVNRIRYLRDARGLSQGQLAELAGVSVWTVSSCERSPADTQRVGSSMRIARALGLTLNDLYQWVDPTA